MYSIHILLLNRCIRGTATLYNFQHLRWRNTNNWLHGIKHLHRSSYPNSTGSSAGGSELELISKWQSEFAFFSNASLEGDSDLTSGVFVTFFYPSFSTRLQHGPWTFSMSPSFWQANHSQLCTSWVSPEQEPWPCHICPRPVGMVTGRIVSREIRDSVVVRRHRRI